MRRRVGREKLSLRRLRVAAVRVRRLRSERGRVERGGRMLVKAAMVGWVDGWMDVLVSARDVEEGCSVGGLKVFVGSKTSSTGLEFGMGGSYNNITDTLSEQVRWQMY